MTMYAASARTCIACASRVHRHVHSNAESIGGCTEIVNRNPRNLERLRIARKPSGYHLERPGRSYWHKLFLEKKARYIVAEVRHFENGPVIMTSSGEWALKRQLYRCTDVSAYINVGRVLAQRCLESSICEMEVDSALTGEKCELLIKAMRDNGIILNEPPVYVFPQFWDKKRLEKPWEIHE